MGYIIIFHVLAIKCISLFSCTK